MGPIALEALVDRIPDGALLAAIPDYSNVPMAATRALIRRGAKELRLLAVPTGGFQTDLLIGAGCVAEVEAAAVGLGEYGSAPRFTEALRSGAIWMRDATCPAIHAGLQASEKGVPFMALRGIIGSDLLGQRADWRVIENPYGERDPIVLVPARQPDIALFHARWADREGNVWLGRRRELITLSHASKATLVTVEAIVEHDLLGDETLAAGVLPALYVDAIALEPGGASPLGLAECYERNAEGLRDYADCAASAQGFKRYLERQVFLEQP